MDFYINFKKNLVKLGRALMLPIAVLPVAGILLRIGQPDVLNIAFISVAGEAIFSNLALIFAVGVAIGFAKESNGAAALAALVGYLVLTNGLKVLNPKVDMGVLGGLIIGGMAGYLYNKYHNIALPTYLAFFGGKRFIAIITGFISLILSFVCSIIWPPIQEVITNFGNWIIASNNIGLFFYGFLNRLLIPTGLHHVLNSVVWFTFGDYSVIEHGQEIVKHGDLWRFFAGDKTAGAFMAGIFPVMMFGLPSAAVAMIIMAKPENRTTVSGILISAALTSFLTGITEPIEFSFMFIAFPLYVIHAALMGLSLVVMNLLDVKLGFTFSAGLFDYILSYRLGHNGWMLFPVGVVFAIIYFFLFVFAIRIFNLSTPGRGEEEQPDNDDIKLSHEAIGLNYLTALGGKDNITFIEACTTRLRLEVNSTEIINEKTLKTLGAHGFIKTGIGQYQVIIGPEVDILLDKIKNAMK